MLGTQVASLFGVIELKDNMTAGLQKAQSGLQGMGSTLRKTGGDVSKFGTRLTLMSVPLIGIGAYSLKAAIDWESAFAGVIKTVDATTEELDILEQGLRDLATGRTGSPVAGLKDAAVTLAGVAEAAGQLGVATDDIIKFSEYMAVLGMATNVTAEEAAVLVAQFANITGMDLQDVDRFASAIVWLGNNAATTEKDILELSQRIAVAGTAAGMSEPQIAGLAAAALSLGFAPERAGTNLSMWLLDIVRIIGENSTELDQFAKIAGMDASGFKELWEADPTDGLIRFLEGLNKLPDEQKFAVLEKFGWTAGTLSPLLLSLAGNTDLLADMIDGATVAWDENTAAMYEAEQRAVTTQSQINELKNKLYDTGITIGQHLLPLISKLADDLGTLAEKTGEVNQETMQMAVYFGLALIALGPAVKVIGTLITVAGAAAGAVGFLGLAATGLVGVFALGILGNLEEFTEHCWDIVNAAREGDIVGVLEGIANALIDIPEGIANIFGDLIGVDVQEGLEAYYGVWENLKTLIDALPGAINAFFDTQRTFTLPGNVLTLHFTWKDIFDKITYLPEKVYGFLKALDSIKVPASLKELWQVFSDIAGWIDKVAHTGFGGGGSMPYEYEGHWGEGGYGQYHQTRQHGGPVQGGRRYLVGEAGPEMFVPHASGMVVPNHAMGGQTIVIQAVYVQDEDPQRWLDRLTDAARMRGSQVVPVM